MNTAKGKPPGIFGWIFLITAALPAAIVGTAAYAWLRWVTEGVQKLSQHTDPSAGPNLFLEQLTQLTGRFWFQGFPVVVIFFLFTALFIWLILKGRIQRAWEAAAPAAPVKKTREASLEPAVDPRIEERVRGRLMVHLLSVFQRDGRLVDFLKEDLSLYEDAQIGAAVRTIHADCGKVLERQLALSPVMDAAEESEVTIPAGFDPVSVKLTGNVTGSPPFKGILRHRGWRAGRLELPVLSGDSDPRIVAPAEVEIL